MKHETESNRTTDSKYIIYSRDTDTNNITTANSTPKNGNTLKQCKI